MRIIIDRPVPCQPNEHFGARAKVKFFSDRGKLQYSFFFPSFFPFPRKNVGLLFNLEARRGPDGSEIPLWRKLGLLLSLEENKFRVHNKLVRR